MRRLFKSVFAKKIIAESSPSICNHHLKAYASLRKKALKAQSIKLIKFHFHEVMKTTKTLREGGREIVIAGKYKVVQENGNKVAKQ